MDDSKLEKLIASLSEEVDEEEPASDKPKSEPSKEPL